MGSSLDKQQQDGDQAKEKLRLNIRMNQDELETLEKIFVERSHFRFPYLCSVAKMMKEEDGTGIFCQSLTRIIIEYEPYDYLLSEVVKNHMMPQVEIEKIIFSVCTALDFLHQKKYRHGDIQPKMICYDKGEWRLIDNCFVKGGITAYEKVLEGEEGFISPAQMQKIRHGFIRQSPSILEADEIFGLGMTCLQLMTGKPSSLCYKQSYLRFNEAALNEKITLVKNTFPQYFSKLVLAMIEMNEQRRIKIKDILTQAFISRHSKKISLKGSLVS